MYRSRAASRAARNIVSQVCGGCRAIKAPRKLSGTPTCRPLGCPHHPETEVLILGYWSLRRCRICPAGCSSACNLPLTSRCHVYVIFYVSSIYFLCIRYRFYLSHIWKADIALSMYMTPSPATDIGATFTSTWLLPLHVYRVYPHIQCTVYSAHPCALHPEHHIIKSKAINGDDSSNYMYGKVWNNICPRNTITYNIQQYGLLFIHQKLQWCAVNIGTISLSLITSLMGPE